MKLLATAALGAGLFVVASASVANFDTKTEGLFSTTIVDGGLTFNNFDAYLGSGPGDIFVIDRADGDLGGFPGFFSPLNVMTFLGYVPGTGVGFGRMGSFDFTDGSLATTASMEVFSLGNAANTTITLQGKLGATVVNSSIITVPTGGIKHTTIALPTGLYDNFHIISNSPVNSGASFVNVDNVRIAGVPEPASLAVIGIGALGVLRRRGKKSSPAK